MQKRSRRDGKNAQNCTKKVLMKQITMMVWSVTQSQTFWSVKSSGPWEALLPVKLVDAMARNRAHQGMGVRAGQKAADSDGKVAAYNAGDPGLNPGLGRSPGEGNGNPLQYSCLENPMDGGSWWATVHGVAKTRT